MKMKSDMNESAFILNLENLGNRAFYEKSGKTWNSQGIFYDFYPSQGKVRENKVFSLHIIFINLLHSCLQSGCSICHQQIRTSSLCIVK